MVARDGVEPPTPAFSAAYYQLIFLVIQQLNFSEWPTFCDHSVTSADVRLSVGQESPTARKGVHYPSRQIGPNYEDSWRGRVASGWISSSLIRTTSLKLIIRRIWFCSSLSIVSGLPCVTVRSCSCNCFFVAWSAFTHVIANTAAQSLATLYIKSSDNFVASAAVSIATGGANQFHGGTRTR